jgi:hypothetical protein
MTKDIYYKLGSKFRRYWWIFFITIGLIIYFSVRDNRSILEKCADKKWIEYNSSNPNNKLKQKLSHSTYERYYASCENEQKNFPSLFKEKYN